MFHYDSYAISFIYNSVHKFMSLPVIDNQKSENDKKSAREKFSLRL